MGRVMRFSTIIRARLQRSTIRRTGTSRAQGKERVALHTVKDRFILSVVRLVVLEHLGLVVFVHY